MTDIQATMPVQPQHTNSDSLNRGWGGAGALGGGIVGLLLGGLLGGGNGLFGGGNAAQTAIGLTNEGLLLQNQSTLNANTNRINDNMTTGFATINSGICGLQQSICQGFGSITHQNDMNTCRLETAIHAEGNATRALITQNEIQALRERNNEQAAIISNLQQTSSIVNQLKQPCPVPAYNVPNPNVATFAAPYPYAQPFGCNPCNPCVSHGCF